MNVYSVLRGISEYAVNKAKDMQRNIKKIDSICFTTNWCFPIHSIVLWGSVTGFAYDFFFQLKVKKL